MKLKKRRKFSRWRARARMDEAGKIVHAALEIKAV